MANERKGQQAGANGGAQRSREGAETEAKDLGNRVREQVAGYGEEARERLDLARESALHGYRQYEGMVARNPSTAVLVGFGVGVGVGLLLTGLLGREERPWYERERDEWARSMGRLPKRAGEWADRFGGWGERFGDQVDEIGKAVVRNLPDSLRRS